MKCATRLAPEATYLYTRFHGISLVLNLYELSHLQTGVGTYPKAIPKSPRVCPKTEEVFRMRTYVKINEVGNVGRYQNEVIEIRGLFLEPIVNSALSN